MNATTLNHLKRWRAVITPTFITVLHLKLRLARVRSKLSARIEAMDDDLDAMNWLTKRIEKNGRALNDLRQKELSILSALNVGDGAQPIT
jgi:hypothetical protein